MRTHHASLFILAGVGYALAASALPIPAHPESKLSVDEGYNGSARASTFKLNWTKVSGADRYELLLDGRVHKTLPASAGSTDFILPLDSKLTYLLRACNGTGCSAPGNSAFPGQRVLYGPPKRPGFTVAWSQVHTKLELGADIRQSVNAEHLRFTTFKCAARCPGVADVHVPDSLRIEHRRDAVGGWVRVSSRALEGPAGNPANPKITSVEPGIYQIAVQACSKSDACSAPAKQRVRVSCPKTDAKSCWPADAKVEVL